MVRKTHWKAETRKVMALSSLVFMLPSSIAVGLFLGYLLDKILGTRPWMIFAFLLLGAASGVYNLLRGLSRLQNEKSPEDSETR